MLLRTRSRFARFVAVLALAAAVLPMGLAAAAPAASITPFESVTVTAHNEQQGTMLFITGTLPADAPLPATIAIPAPPDSQLQWAGEILGGDLSDDITAQPQSQVTSDTAVHTFGLTKSRIAQIEALAPGVFTAGPSVTDVKLRWVANTDLATAVLQVRLPQNAGISVPAEGAQTTDADPGFVYYSKTFTGVKAGQPLELAVSYVPPASTGAPGGATQKSSVAPLMIVLGAVLVFAFAGFAIYRKSVAARIAEEQVTGRPTRTVQSRVQEPVEDDGAFDVEASDEVADYSSDIISEEPQVKANRLPLIIAGVVIAFVIGLTVATSNAGGGVGVKKVTDTAVEKILWDVNADKSVVLPIQMNEGGDVEHESDHVFEALQTTPGIGKVSVAKTGVSLTVEYESAQVDETTIKAALAAGGYPTP